MARKPELGKWLLWLHFRKNLTLRSYLPATALYSSEKLREFIQKYPTVYVKPQAGSRGMGVIKVSRVKEGFQVKHTVRPARKFTTIQDAIRYINQLRGQRGYIVQRGISLAKVRGRAFDVRVMVQKTRPGGVWQYSGMVAKIAGPGSVVTNVALSRGRVVQFSEAMRESLQLNVENTNKLEKDLIRLSLLAAEHFDKYQPYREIGFDWAVDTQGRIWLLEENTGPSHGLFHKLKTDLSQYKLIQRRWSSYQQALSHRRSKSSSKTVSG